MFIINLIKKKIYKLEKNSILKTLINIKYKLFYLITFLFIYIHLYHLLLLKQQKFSKKILL